MGKWGSWTRRPTSPATIVPMSLQPAIPSWVALQQSPCPLRRLLTASRPILLLYSQQQQTVTCPYLRCLNTGVHSRTDGGQDRRGTDGTFTYLLRLLLQR